MSGEESKLEAKVRKYALKEGWFVLKLISNRYGGLPGIPDRLFLRAGVFVFIEFKSKKGRTSKVQDNIIKILKEHGANVFVVDDYDDAVKFLNICLTSQKKHLNIDT